MQGNATTWLFPTLCCITGEGRWPRGKCKGSLRCIHPFYLQKADVAISSCCVFKRQNRTKLCPRPSSIPSCSQRKQMLVPAQCGSLPLPSPTWERLSTEGAFPFSPLPLNPGNAGARSQSQQNGWLGLWMYEPRSGAGLLREAPLHGREA